MRKRLLFGLTVALLLASTSFSQVKFGFGPHFGIGFSSMPKGISDYYGMGFNFGAQGQVELMKNIGIQLEFDYATYSSDKSKIAAANGIQSSDLSGWNISVVGINVEGVGKLPLSGGVTPYGMVGFGLNISGASDLKYKGNLAAAGGDSKTNFGILFGVGTEYKVSKSIGVFADFKFRLVFSEGSSTSLLPFTFGMNFWL
jgi:opacity protein-like surface antigen